MVSKAFFLLFALAGSVEAVPKKLLHRDKFPDYNGQHGSDLTTLIVGGDPVDPYEYPYFGKKAPASLEQEALSNTTAIHSLD